MKSSAFSAHTPITRLVLKIEEIVDSWGLTTDAKLRNAMREGRLETVAIIRRLQGK